jgi:hypothetical protein
MSHFYGIISDSARKTQPTARAHHGLTVEAQSWEGKIVTTLSREKDGDYYEVWRRPHHSSGGDSMLLAKGKIKEPTEAILDRFAGE